MTHRLTYTFPNISLHDYELEVCPCFVCSFKIAISGEEISYVGYAFTDYTDLVTAGKDNKTNKDVVKAMQGAADGFEGGVRATGGP